MHTIDVGIEIEEIIKASKLTQEIEFRKSIQLSDNLYGNGRCADEIINCFESVEKEKLFLKKSIF